VWISSGRLEPIAVVSALPSADVGLAERQTLFVAQLLDLPWQAVGGAIERAEVALNEIGDSLPHNW
jgi:hypothetical protein